MYSKKERKEQIIAYLESVEQGVTLGEICKHLELKRSNYVNLMVVDLVNEGRAKCEWFDHPQFGRCRLFGAVRS